MLGHYGRGLGVLDPTSYTVKNGVQVLTPAARASLDSYLNGQVFMFVGPGAQPKDMIEFATILSEPATKSGQWVPATGATPGETVTGRMVVAEALKSGAFVFISPDSVTSPMTGVYFHALKSMDDPRAKQWVLFAAPTGGGKLMGMGPVGIAAVVLVGAGVLYYMTQGKRRAPSRYYGNKRRRHHKRAA